MNDKKKKIVRCTICAMMLVVFFASGCGSKTGTFAWSYDDQTNIIQVSNETDEEILVEIKMFVGEMETKKRLILQEQESAEVNLEEYFSENILQNTEAEITISEMYMIYPGSIILFLTGIFILIVLDIIVRR